LSRSSQPLVPQHLFMAGAANGEAAAGGPGGMLGLLINLLVAERAGFDPANGNTANLGPLKEFGERLTREAMESLQQPAPVAK
jgi:hypothetical protein